MAKWDYLVEAKLRVCVSCGLTDDDFIEAGRTFGKHRTIKCNRCFQWGKKHGWCTTNTHCLPPKSKNVLPDPTSGKKMGTPLRDYPRCKCLTKSRPPSPNYLDPRSRYPERIPIEDEDSPKFKYIAVKNRPEYKKWMEKKKELSKAKEREREKERAKRRRERFSKDPEYAEKRRQQRREADRRKKKRDPEGVKRKKREEARTRRARETPEEKEARLAKRRKKYKDDPEFRKKLLAKHREEYREDPEFYRKQERERYRRKKKKKKEGDA
jgi:hypothetical protein